MQSLWINWPSVSRKLKKAKYRLFLFDVDGTLSPIVKNPRQVRVNQAVRKKLKELNARKQTSVGILSGRSLTKARRMVGISSMIYAGNHGLEIAGPKLSFVHPEARRRRDLVQEAERQLQIVFRTVSGLIYENKGLSFSVHFRRVKDANRKKFLDKFHRFIQAWTLRRFLTIRHGKCVYEILPKTSWNKGAALKLIRRKIKEKPVVLFAGDDHTDEDAFAALRKNDIGIQIGTNPKSKAAYFLRDQTEVHRLLTELCKL